ncbi:MAG: lysine decarboxylase, partial [Pseudomonadota bacterium]
MARKQVVFPNAEEDLSIAAGVPDTPQTRAPAYRLAFADSDFMCRDELRGTRIMLEMLKPELVMAERGIESTVVMFGGARIPDPEKADSARTKTLAGLAKYYAEAREFARLMTRRSMESYGRENVVVT